MSTIVDIIFHIGLSTIKNNQCENTRIFIFTLIRKNQVLK